MSAINIVRSRSLQIVSECAISYCAIGITVCLHSLDECDMRAGASTTDWYLRLKREGWRGELTLMTAQARSCDFTRGISSSS